MFLNSIPKSLVVLFLSLTPVFAESQEIGNNPNSVTGILDGWNSILVIDEVATYTNTSGNNQLVTPIGFDFQVRNNRGRMTPFIVKRNANNDFTTVAIGTTRISGSDYNSLGVFEFSFGTNPPQISLAPGETLAAGMSNANPNGTGNGGSVIPFNNGGNEIQLTGGPSSSDAGNLVLNADPQNTGSNTLSLNRTYAFSIDLDVVPESIAPPTDIIYTGAQPVSGLPSGITLGTFSTVDSDVADTHTYTLVSNPSNKYALSGADLLTNDTASSQTIRIRTTDLTGNTFEKNFTFTVEAQSPITGIDPGATQISTFGLTGDLVGVLQGIDPNASDQFTFSLVSGTGDGNNSLFTITGQELKLASTIPAGLTIVSFRIRATDLGGSSVEQSFTFAVSAPALVINEILSSNSGGLTDEDGDTSDWIEIYNPTGSCVNLDGWFLTDDDGDRQKWEFPDFDLMPGGYLIVFASSKNRNVAGSELHTNFRLSSSGDYLALVAPGGIHVIDALPENIPQFTNISYSEQGYLDPTPAAANGTAFANASEEVSFSQPRGSYSSPFNLTLTAPAGSQIRYTLDFTKPTQTSGTLYTGPISITPSTTGSRRGLRIVRAIAYGGNSLRHPVSTHTYLFIDQAATQSNFTSAITGHSTYGPLMDDSLLAHPIISITSTQGVPGSTENEISIELFDPLEQEAGFQIDCGIKAVGGASLASPKNNFRLFFRSDYGASRLDYPLFAGHPYSLSQADSFNRLNLRSGSHDTFHWLANPSNPANSGGPIKGDALYIRNRWMSDTQLQMGQPAMHGRWVQVFINGSYHGQYHLLEHPNEDFQAEYLGGDKSAYEFSNSANASKTGSDNWQTVWAQLKTAVSQGSPNAADWVDYKNLADFMVLGFYSGNPWDWNPNQNWLTGGPNQPGQGGWQFYSWDSDIIFQDPGANVLSKNVPDGVFQTLITDPEFAIVFRDQVYQHCFHNGLLTPAEAQRTFDARAAEIELSIVAETARWQGTSFTWGRDDEWDTELNRMRNTYFPNRHTTVVSQFRAAGWYPVEAPEYTLRGGTVASGYQPSITAAAGTIYYTTNGSDPRLTGGSVSSSAQVFTNGSITITSATQIRTRAFSGGEWSPVNTANFTITGTVPPTAGQLAVTEVHYNPFGSDDTEFLEIQNTSSSPLDLSGVTLSSAVAYTFPGNTILQPNAFIIVVEDVTAFQARYQTVSSPYYQATATVSGAWAGALSNSGETLIISAADTTQLLSLTWNDSGRSDGEGSSLEYPTPTTPRPSSEYHGTPGILGSGPDNRIVINELLARPDSKIELANRTASNITITNWFLTDELAIPSKYTFPSTTLTNGSYNTFTNILTLDPSLGGELSLLEADALGNPLRFVDKVSFRPSASGEAIGRWPDGTGSLHPMTVQTFALPNFAFENKVRSGPVIIREFHYHPSGLEDHREFVEIWNSGSVTESLDHWTLRGEVDFDFPNGINLISGASVIIVDFDPTDTALANAFRSTYSLPVSASLLGPWGLGERLDNSGGEVRLQRADALVTPTNGTPAFYPQLIEDSVEYDDTSPWPTAADGGGSSLRRLDPNTYGDDPANWFAETSPLSGMTFSDWAPTILAAHPTEQGPNDDPDKDGLSNLIEFALGSSPTETSINPVRLTAQMTVSYPRRLNASGLSYLIEVSNNLVDWDKTGNQVTPMGTSPMNGSFEEVMVEIQPTITDRTFIRLSVTAP